MKEEKTIPSFPIPKETPKDIIKCFLSQTQKLSMLEEDEEEKITVFQNYDKKTLSFYESDIEKVLERKDYSEEAFLQVDFKNGKKILLTNEFVGFSPAVSTETEMEAQKLPKVVTTADLLSVIEAIENSLYGTDQYHESLHDIKLFFETIASGAESVGFNLVGERLWVDRLLLENTA